MVNLLKSEWYKLRKDQIFRVLTGILVVFSILYPLTLLGGNFDYETNIFYMGHVLSLNLEVLIRTLPCILAGFFISSEYSMGTMKSMASSGNSRTRIYVSKLIVFMVGTIIVSLTLPILMTGASGIYFGSTVLPEASYFLQSIGIIALFAAAFASIMSFFSIIFTDSGKTIGFLIFFMVFSDTVLQMLSLRIEFFEPIAENTVFRLLGNVFTLDQLTSHEWFMMFAVPIGTILVFGALGILVFRRKEIK